MDTDSRAMGALRIILLGLIAAWVAFMAGTYYLYSGPGYFGSSQEGVDLSRYLFLAAVILGGAGALWGKRRAARLPATRGSRGVYLHGVVALIVAIVAGGWGLLVVFFDLFDTEYASAGLRLVNTYLPILAFTGVVVFFLLAGFVFRTPHAPAAPTPPVPPVPDDTAGPSADGAPESATRAGALGYAVPIIAGALAAIVGGIIYDLTQTSLTAWLWALIFAIIAAGVIAGTHFASAAPTAPGAYGLNLAWVITFTAVVSITAFGFGAAAVDALHLNSGISLDVYADSQETTAEISGYDLAPHSEVVLMADSEAVHTGEADRDGWYFDTVALPDGTGTLRLSATAADGGGLSATMSTPDQVEAAYDDVSRTLPISGAWLARDVLPGLLMLLSVCLVVHTTAGMRGARRAGVGDNR